MTKYAIGYVSGQAYDTPKYLYRQGDQEFLLASEGKLQESDSSFTPLVYLLPAPISEEIMARSIINFAESKFGQALLKIGHSWRLYEKDKKGTIQVFSGEIKKQPHLKTDIVVFRPARLLTPNTVEREVFEVYLLHTLANPPIVKEYPVSRVALIYSRKIWPTASDKITLNPFDKKEFLKLK